jgi:hypothetical protein
LIDHLPTKGIVSLLALAISTAVIGCSPAPDYRDQRLAEFAKQSAAQQSQQNNRIADLVEQNAKSRQDFLEAHETLTMQINSQQSALDTARSQLEQDRKDIASQRHRDPIIAAAIQGVGVFFACLLPLAVAMFVIWQMRSQGQDESAVADLLITELTAEKPLFLPASVLPKLTAKPMAAQPSDNSDNVSEFPF